MTGHTTVLFRWGKCGDSVMRFKKKKKKQGLLGSINLLPCTWYTKNSKHNAAEYGK